MYPERFLNITNGVTPRRWILLSNPRLSALITNTIEDRWTEHLDELKQLEAFADDLNLIKKWQQVKHENKIDLSAVILTKTGISINPDTLFDVQMKRLHECNRHLLNVLHIITLFNRIRKNSQTDITPRTFIFGGKSSPGYFMANLIIKLINCVAEVVNNDPNVAERLKVVFFPNFNVRNAQIVCPAADLSEQISTAGKEASGTGNMKFAMNGALTIGTSGATNREILKEVGAENFYLFGLTAEEVNHIKSQGYNPMIYYNENPDLKEVIDLIGSGFFSPRDVNMFKPLIDSLLRRDEHMVLADYQSYIKCQDHLGMLYKDRQKWTKMSILTVARMGKFSSDRSIREYNEKIWHATPLKIDLENT
jgi:starch phosphorylase